MAPTESQRTLPNPVKKDRDHLTTRVAQPPPYPPPSSSIFHFPFSISRRLNVHRFPSVMFKAITISPWNGSDRSEQTVGAPKVCIFLSKSVQGIVDLAPAPQ